MIKKILLTVLPLLAFITFNAVADTLSIDINNIAVNKGNLYIGVFNNNANFPVESKTFKNRILASKKAVMHATFDVPAGDYAIAIFQDHNNNTHLDKNFFGIPVERYGFSGKQVFGKPTFKDAKIHVKSKQNVTISLK